MRRCILHFGMHKTGSSSIQESLHGASSLRGAHYVNLGHANASGSLQAAFTDDVAAKMRRRHGVDEDHLERKRAKTLAALAQAFKADADCFVISAESLSNFQAHELKRLVDVLLTHVDKVEAVGYVRDARGFMESAFQQHVRAGQTKKWHPDLLYPNYRKRFEKFDQILGAQQVHFWPFEPASFTGGDVVRDFCERTGLTVDEADIRRVNEGLSGDAVLLLYLFRKFGLPHVGSREDIARNRVLLAHMAQLGGPRTRFAPELLAPVIAAHREDLDWIESRVGRSLSTLGEGRPGDIRDEKDLLRPSHAGLCWLAAQVGETEPSTDSLVTPQAIARQMYLLSTRLGEGGGSSHPADGGVAAGAPSADLDRALRNERRAKLQARRVARGGQQRVRV